MIQIAIKFWITLSGTAFVNWLMKILLLCIAFLTPFKALLIMAILFTVLDLITGMWASYRRKIKFSSNKLYRSINKIIAYPLSIIVVAIFQVIMNLEILYLVNITAGMIAFVELVSIFENCYKITDEPVFKKIIKLISKKYYDKIGVEDDKKDNKK